VKLLLDTHYLVWLAREPSKLTAADHAFLTREGGELLVSPVSIWEIRLKWQVFDRNGNRKGMLDPELAMAFVEEGDMELVPLTGADCAAALDPPMPHKDPFDEMLLIHAQQLGARLFTRDRLLVDHPLAITP
jgi:PIN domain nuclease of toxin-antitoxin system